MGPHFTTHFNFSPSSSRTVSSPLIHLRSRQQIITMAAAAFSVIAAAAAVSRMGHRQLQNSWKQEVTKDWNAVNKTEVFEEWKADFNKQYKDIEEETHAFLTFVENWKRINDFNTAGKEGYTLRLNQFGDLNEDEFKLYVHGHTGSCLGPNVDRKSLILPETSPNVNAPAAIDWTNQTGGSFVTAVKNQGSCGSCWAFSTTGSLESRASIKHNLTGDAIVSLSEQQLVDCSGSYGNQGCEGGLMDDAFKYIKEEGGLCSEDEYKYTGKDGTCQASSCQTLYDPITSYKDVTGSSYQSMEEAVAEGPVSIAIEADTFAFQFYHGGVFTGNCGTKLDHGVLAVGYGEENGQKFWKVKNSWGSSWGMKGYILICKECNKNGNDGQCGMLMQPSYPIVA